MKKIIKFVAACAVALAASTALFAEIPENWNFSIGVDTAYYPLSDKLTGNDSTHFAPLTGAYSGLEGRVTGNAAYTIATPLGEHWLVSGANVVLGSGLELTPVSVKPFASVTFTPVPFLVFSAGAQAGTGWDAGPFKGGMCFYDLKSGTYNASEAFQHVFYKGWAQGTFQFDTGAVFAGDWTHVVMQYAYQVYYEGLSGASAGDIWKWQCSGDRVNGLRNYQCGIVAYQMPLVLYRVGVMYESDGYYKDSAFANPDYKGSFKSLSISPLAQLKINDHNTLALLAGFSSRRSYKTKPTGDAEAANGKFASREWFFNRVAISYTYNF